jgi:chromosome transmission fidelity protein 18
LTEHVLRAMESSTLSTSAEAAKPNCLILDEIDGVDARGAIQALVEIIRAEMPIKGGTQKKKGFTAPYLRRPIIFICNNKYAPALRPLLPFARHFNVFPAHSNHRLIARLRTVLSAEKLSLSGGNSLLHQLASATCGDIRSCLFTLQFASARVNVMASTDARKSSTDASVDISEALVSALDGDGMKDERNDVSAAITMVFRRKKDGALPGEAGNSKHDDRLSADRVVDSIQVRSICEYAFRLAMLNDCSNRHGWLRCLFVCLPAFR